MAEEKNDAEAATSHDELKRQKRKKLILYVVVFIIFQIFVIAAFSQVVMKAKSPKLRLGQIQVQSLGLGSSTTSSPFFDLSFNAEVRVKNPNFGRYKFEDTVVTFTYEGVILGQVLVPRGKAGLRSTEEIDVMVNVNSNVLAGIPNNNLAGELNAGILKIGSNAVMRGKVEIMGIIKKNKNAVMNCFMTFDLAARQIRTLDCQ
ncbi:hypothetical protein UlMin_002149 [Ulmus minor]